ncbi:sugar kinase [Massilia rhizosphaerae]|uniref:sugar kinase n=1 Tax=Massilia rhizosphaerae TaxID=2784389 RepID=UPI0018DE83BF|nr:sugar kinase [Massilia rhizosphaerae]
MSAHPDLPGRIVCFGEILLRLAAPPGRIPLQTPAFDAGTDGAEANVAVALALLGHRAAMVSVLPDNPLGRAALDGLRAHGVDTAGIRLQPGRMGLYFLDPGAGKQPTDIIYDRAGSAYALADPDLYDWSALLDGAAWLHVSGIAPAVGDGPAQAVLTAMRAARARGVRVAFDGSYRAPLWAERGQDGAPLLLEAMRQADALFAGPRDIALVLGRPELADPARDAEVARTAFAAFPNLTLLAWTRGVQHGAGNHELSAVLHTRTKSVTGGSYRLSGTVDRIGTGDAFAAGVLHGLQTDMEPADVAGFALAAAALKHAVTGDVNPARAERIGAAHTGAHDARR